SRDWSSDVCSSDLLVVSFPRGLDRYREQFPDFQPLDQQELFVEMERFLSELALEDTVFRSDHASNSLVLKGVLGRDKERMLAQVRTAIEQPDRAGLRAEWMRGL